MFDIVKQSVFASIGLASLTREKVENLAAEIADRAKLSEQHTKEFAAELSTRAEQARKELAEEVDRRIDHAFIQLGIVKSGVKEAGAAAAVELQAFVDQRIDAALARLNIARTEEVEALQQRLDRLEKKLNG